MQLHEGFKPIVTSNLFKVKCDFMTLSNLLCRVKRAPSKYLVFLSSVTIEIRIVAWPIMRVSAVFFFSFLWRLLVNLVPVVVFPEWDIKNR